VVDTGLLLQTLIASASHKDLSWILSFGMTLNAHGVVLDHTQTLDGCWKQGMICFCKDEAGLNADPFLFSPGNDLIVVPGSVILHELYYC
jgi:hypothetical protein